MRYWIPYAFLRISVSFIAGILTALSFPRLLEESALIAVFTILMILFMIVFAVNWRTRRNVVNPGLIGLIAIFIAGYLNVCVKDLRNAPNHLDKTSEKITYYTARVSGIGQEKDRFYKDVVEVSKVFSNGVWSESCGKILVYFPKGQFEHAFHYGDVLLIKGTPQEIPGPSNPGEFDQKKFLSYRNITHQHFVKSTNVLAIGHQPSSSLMQVSLQVREWAEKQLKNVVAGQREQAIACALVLGITEGLDNELMGAYSATGAMHVLSVSGLHVGILYLLLMLLLKPFGKLKHGKWITAGTIFFLLWMYACVTGLSPSVLRAVTMFSFMVVAKPIGRRTNIYNVLAASAFLLLLFDPWLIMSVGFQLSYLAVAGIVYLQPLLYSLKEFDNRLADEIWKVTTVSIAAQLATFSLGLFYFNQFPNYFLLSNLYVLPLGFIILVAGIAVLVFSFVPIISAWIGIVLTWSVKLLNFLIFKTESLPFSVIDGVYINLTQCVLLLCLIVFLTLFLQLRKMYYATLFVVGIILFAFASIVEFYRAGMDRTFTVYKVSGSSAYEMMESGNSYFFADSVLQNNMAKIRYHIEPNRTGHFISKVNSGATQSFSKSLVFGRLTIWNGVTFLQLTSANNLPQGLRADYLIISKDCVKNMSELIKYVEFQHIIVDSSNSFKFADKLLNDPALRKWNVHSVWHHGAFNKTI